MRIVTTKTENKVRQDFEEVKNAVKNIKRQLPFMFGNTTYSQFGEDLYLLNCMRAKRQNYGSLNKGFFVDIGAHHPFRYSTTALFYEEMGWTGINIEPNPDGIQEFNNYRPNDINLNFGVANEDGELKYFMFNDPAFNSFSEEFSEECVQGGGSLKLLETRNIPVRKLSTLLEQHLPQGQEIDFFSIDAEGLDLEILKSNNWQKFRPEFILIEINHDKDNGIHKFLVEQNYSMVNLALITAIYQRKD